jgi:hypothetical protein
MQRRFHHFNVERKKRGAAAPRRCWTSIIQALVICWAIIFCTSASAVGTWSPLTNKAPAGIDVMLLLMDGTVIATGNNTTNWYRLTPDSTGNYAHGTWTTIASMNDKRIYYSADVLLDGRVFIVGGSVGSGQTTAEVYDRWPTSGQSRR